MWSSRELHCIPALSPRPQLTFIPFNEPKFDDEEREKSIAAKVKDPRINMFPPPIGRAMNAVGAGTALRVREGTRTGRLTLAGQPVPLPFLCRSAVILTTTPPRTHGLRCNSDTRRFHLACVPLTRTPRPPHPRAC